MEWNLRKEAIRWMCRCYLKLAERVHFTIGGKGKFAKFLQYFVLKMHFNEHNTDVSVLESETIQNETKQKSFETLSSRYTDAVVFEQLFVISVFIRKKM